LVRFGRSFHEIVAVARRRKVDLILIATHGYSGLKHALLGSTTERVVRLAPCAVLVVRQC
jgi:universal stress protein A